jgi:hypothetical protein
MGWGRLDLDLNVKWNISSISGKTSTAVKYISKDESLKYPFKGKE